MNDLRFFLEKHGFMVASRLAERLGFKTRNVRLFFIYSSFVTLGGLSVAYLFMAFALMAKDLVRTKRSSVFDL